MAYLTTVGQRGADQTEPSKEKTAVKVSDPRCHRQGNTSHGCRSGTAARSDIQHTSQCSGAIVSVQARYDSRVKYDTHTHTHTRTHESVSLGSVPFFAAFGCTGVCSLCFVGCGSV